ncbi:MAG: hypothetical protein ED859_01695 [Desulfuromonadales bacterium]|nr:MAG: hypothetical protein ED859_01695 [Desulfuromonadales bacterium]
MKNWQDEAIAMRKAADDKEAEKIGKKNVNNSAIESLMSRIIAANNKVDEKCRLNTYQFNQIIKLEKCYNNEHHIDLDIINVNTYTIEYNMTDGKCYLKIFTVEPFLLIYKKSYMNLYSVYTDSDIDNLLKAVYLSKRIYTYLTLHRKISLDFVE